MALRLVKILGGADMAIARFRRFARCIPWAIIVLGMAYWMCERWLDIDPDPASANQFPTHRSPAAYTFYLAAQKGIRHREDITKALEPPRAPKITPMPKAPYPGMPPGSTKTLLTPTIRPKRLTLADKRNLVEMNRDCLATFRIGLRYPYVAPTPPDFPLDEPWFYSLAQLIALNGKIKQADEDWGGAIDAYLDCVELGSVVATNSPEGRAYGAILVQDLGRHYAWPIIGRLNRADTRTSLQRMQKMTAKPGRYADILREERDYTRKGMLKDFRRPHWRHEFSQGFDLLDGEDHTIERIRCYTTSKRKILRVYTETMNKIIDESTLPCAAKRRAPPVVDDFFYYWGLGEYGPTVNTHTRTMWEYCHAGNELLIVALALHLWKFDHATYPDKLDRLTPDYMKTLPADPFALHGTFKYNVKGDKYVLYSLGPDCRDNGGRHAIRSPYNHPNGANDYPKFDGADMVVGRTY